MVHAKMVAMFEMTKQPNLKDQPGKSTQRRVISHAHCFLTVCEKTRSHHETQGNREKRDIKLPWWQNFWISTIVLDKDGHLHWRTIEESCGLPFCSWVQSGTGKSYMSIFSFFLLYWQDGDGFCWDPERLLPWQREVTTSPLYWQMFWRNS